jgi:Fe-Mn family superoxide dismutase
MAFELPALAYPYDALEPHLDARTMEIHHGKHHATYVTNLNNAVAGHPDLQEKTIESIIADLNQVPESIRATVRNHGGGHLNHSMYWQMMGPGKGGAPSGALARAIDKAFGSFDAFKDGFSKAAVGRFGSGWGWLVKDTSGGLQILATANQDSPLSDGLKPLLTVDVWEHAYYLKYQNRRADFVAAWWNVVNWDYVAKLLEA